MRVHLFVVSCLLLTLAIAVVSDSVASATTFFVTNTSQSGAFSLRQAIIDANNSPGVDVVLFAIPSGACAADGVCTISLSSSLPVITEGIVIDGTSQPRFGTAPDNVCAARGTPSSMRVLVTSTADTVFTIEATTGHTTIRGLAVAGSSSTNGIRIDTLAGTTVQCNHFGIDGPGRTVLDLLYGVVIGGTGSGGNATIGTNGDADSGRGERNVFGAGGYGVYVNRGEPMHPNRISGNYFGVGADGITAMDLNRGIRLRQSATLNLVGSDLDGTSDQHEHNVFAYLDTGILVDSRSGDGDGNRIIGNWFGIDAYGRPAPIAESAIRVKDEGQDHEVGRNQVLWSSTGIEIEDGATLAVTSGNNCIVGNAVGMRHEGSAINLDAEYNYWGASDGPGGDGPGSGDPLEVVGTGSVDFTPWLVSATSVPVAVCVTITADGFESGDFGAWSAVIQ